jgi:hypothetical protein
MCQMCEEYEAELGRIEQRAAQRQHLERSQDDQSPKPEVIPRRAPEDAHSSEDQLR